MLTLSDADASKLIASLRSALEAVSEALALLQPAPGAQVQANAKLVPAYRLMASPGVRKRGSRSVNASSRIAIIGSANGNPVTVPRQTSGHIFSSVFDVRFA